MDKLIFSSNASSNLAPPVLQTLSTTGKYGLKLITQSITGIGVNMLPAGGYVASLNLSGSKFLSLLYNIYFSFLGFLFRFVLYHIFLFPLFPLLLLLTIL